jgi:hypothetical protein
VNRFSPFSEGETTRVIMDRDAEKAPLLSGQGGEQTSFIDEMIRKKPKRVAESRFATLPVMNTGCLFLLLS